MPESAARLLDLLGVAESDRSFDRLGNAARAVAGRPLPAPEGVFPRYVEPDQSN